MIFKFSVLIFCGYLILIQGIYVRFRFHFYYNIVELKYTHINTYTHARYELLEGEFSSNISGEHVAWLRFWNLETNKEAGRISARGGGGQDAGRKNSFQRK